MLLTVVFILFRCYSYRCKSLDVCISSDLFVALQPDAYNGLFSSRDESIWFNEPSGVFYIVLIVIKELEWI
jgi:hypothetical protein